MDQAADKDEKDPIEFIKPVLKFSTVHMVIGEGDRASEVSVSEFVRKGQLLIEFPDPDQFNDKKKQRQPVIAGPNCTASEDKNTIYANAHGYPRIAYSRPPEAETTVLTVTVEPLFRISANRMKASISIHPPIPDCPSLAHESLRSLIQEEGINFGIIEENLALIEECIDKGLCEFNVFTFAQGKPPSHGKDAYLRFEVETGPIPGKILSDGSIDFRERMIFVPVTKGEIIATKIPATIGSSGKTIYGESVDPNPGKDIVVKTLKDATYSSKTRKVTAGANGVLSVVGNAIIKVCSKQEITSDIDYNTGHIESRNTVLIHGSVQPSFKVTTDGDLEIRGSVMSTRISSNSNIIIKSGITGKNSIITAQGDVDFYFVEQGKISAGNNCIIRKQSYYSSVTAGANIRCPVKSVVVGGQIVAAGNLTLGNVGTANSAPAIIAAGVDGERLEHYNSLHKQLLEQQESLIQWMQMHKGTAKARKIKSMERNVEEIKLKILRLNLIPGTGIYSRAREGDDTSKLKGADYSSDGGIDMSQIYIELHGIIFKGTKIMIGNRSLKLDNTISGRLFRLNEAQTEVVPLPLRKRYRHKSM